MKRLAVVGFIAIFPILCVRAADPDVSFSGTWILDTKESEPFLHPVVGLGGQGLLDAGELNPDRSGTPSGMDRGAGPMGGGGRGMSGGRGPQMPVASPPLMIRQSESLVEIARITKVSDKEVPVVDKFKIDGSEDVSMVQVPNSPDPVKVTTRATLKKGKFVVLMTSFIPRGKSEMKKEYSLSKDGKTLTLNTTNTTLKGNLIQKQVYHKQDAN
jgi:hypothetical protein